jgi:hypothetical protein
VRLRHVVLFGVVTLALVAFGAGAGRAYAQSTVPGAGGRSTCQIFDIRNRPANEFERGEQIIVRGVDFTPGAAVTIAFDQQGQTSELAQVRADSSGGISTSATETTVPGSARPGPAQIGASDGSHTGTCVIAITPTAAHRSRGWYALWIGLLAAFGVFLVTVSFRRWRQKWLESRIAALGDVAPEPVTAQTVSVAGVRPLLDLEPDYIEEEDPETFAYGPKAKDRTTEGRREPPVLPESREEEFAPRPSKKSAKKSAAKTSAKKESPTKTSATVTRLLREAKEWDR